MPGSRMDGDYTGPDPSLISGEVPRWRAWTGPDIGPMHDYKTETYNGGPTIEVVNPDPATLATRASRGGAAAFRQALREFVGSPEGHGEHVVLAREPQHAQQFDSPEGQDQELQPADVFARRIPPCLTC